MLGCKITVNDLLCKMLGKVLPRHPLANATFDGKTLYTHKHVNLSVAVGAENGLMVPVVKNADQLSLCEISRKVRDLAARAKTKSLLPDEQSGGTCTINPPQTVICGFGRTVRRAVIMLDDTIAPHSMMNVFPTFDHQVLDDLEVGCILRVLYRASRDDFGLIMEGNVPWKLRLLEAVPAAMLPRSGSPSWAPG